MTVDLTRRYPRHRSLEQRLVGAVLTGVAVARFAIPDLLLDRQERKAGRR